MGPGWWRVVKNSGKIFFFFISSQTSPLEENSRTPNARGVFGNTTLTEIFYHHMHELRKQKANTVPWLGPTPAIHTWPGICPKFGPRLRPGLASGREAKTTRPVRECGAAGLPLSERVHSSASKSSNRENPTLLGKTEEEEGKAKPA